MLWKLYQKSALWFALFWIILYVVGMSAADEASLALGCAKSITLPFSLALCLLAVIWMRRHGLYKHFGLCGTPVPARRYLWYLPLALLASVNIWFGMQLSQPLPEALLYVGSMLCVGFLEEVIFRGFLFRAMEKSSLRAAIIVSSVTFGIGHIINLLSGAELLSTLCQIVSAAAFGFLFVVIFYRGQSLWPCILTHSAINGLSVFYNEAAATPTQTIFVSLFLCAGAIVYTLLLHRLLPKAPTANE